VFLRGDFSEDTHLQRLVWTPIRCLLDDPRCLVALMRLPSDGSTPAPRFRGSRLGRGFPGKTTGFRLPIFSFLPHLWDHSGGGGVAVLVFFGVVGVGGGGWVFLFFLFGFGGVLN